MRVLAIPNTNFTDKNTDFWSEIMRQSAPFMVEIFVFLRRPRRFATAGSCLKNCCDDNFFLRIENAPTLVKSVPFLFSNGVFDKIPPPVLNELRVEVIEFCSNFEVFGNFRLFLKNL